MPSGVIAQNKRENLPRVCRALAFLGMDTVPGFVFGSLAGVGTWN